MKNVVSSVTSGVKSKVESSAKNIKKLVKGTDLTYEDLRAIEARRRAILKRSQLPFYRILAFWDGTVLRTLGTDFLFWFTMIIYLAVRIQARVGLPDFVSDIKTSDIGVIGGFLSFFLVFFVVQNNNRFDLLYGESMKIKGRIFDVATMARSCSTMPLTNSLRMIRYMNAANIAAYVGLSDEYTFDNFFVELNAQNRFLTDTEVARAREIDMNGGGSCSREFCAWAMMEVNRALQEGFLDEQHASQFRENILGVRRAVGTIFNLDDQPVSFFYVHFLSLLSALYLPLFSVSTAYNAGTGDSSYWTSDLLAGLIVMLQCIFVIGLRLLATKMSDPFGSDVEDLSVMHYVNFTWLHSQRVLRASTPAPLDDAVEQRMASEHMSIGGAWGGHDLEVVVVDPVGEQEEGIEIGSWEEDFSHRASWIDNAGSRLTQLNSYTIVVVSCNMLWQP